jgi:hypothetical protein
MIESEGSTISMSTSIVLPTTLPYPPGNSPFHVKGSVYVGLRRRLDAELPGGLRRIVHRLGDPELEKFCLQAFLSNAWYDYFPLLLIARAATIAHMKDTADKRSFEQVIEDDAAKHAESDLGGVYKILLRFTSPESAMRRQSYVLRQYYDFGAIEVQKLEEGLSELYVRGWPTIGLPLLRAYNCAFTHRIVVLSGGRDPHSEWGEVEPDGTMAGVDLGKVFVRTTWK